MSVKTAGETAKSVCLGSAPLWVLGQRSIVLGTFIPFLYGLFGPLTTAYCAYFAKRALYVVVLLPSEGRGHRFESCRVRQFIVYL